jgi:hypothetical protein
MTMYATPGDLASFLQKDLDAATATLVLTKATALFDQRSRSHWSGAVATTYSKPGTGAFELVMPFAPLVTVSAVRVKGVAITDYTTIGQSLYRRIGFGSWYSFPPDLVEVDYTYGYPTVTDDVAAAVIETAALAYQSPDLSTVAEAIDDYSAKYAVNIGGMKLSDSAAALADWYAGALVG